VFHSIQDDTGGADPGALVDEVGDDSSEDEDTSSSSDDVDEMGLHVADDIQDDPNCTNSASPTPEVAAEFSQDEAVNDGSGAPGEHNGGA